MGIEYLPYKGTKYPVLRRNAPTAKGQKYPKSVGKTLLGYSWQIKD